MKEDQYRLVEYIENTVINETNVMLYRFNKEVGRYLPTSLSQETRIEIVSHEDGSIGDRMKHISKEKQKMQVRTIFVFK